jgi:hypothetical protein
MFSLCIPTMDRYNDFLKNNIPKYISNDLIGEIIITDENGNDIKLIKDNFNNDKLKLYTNDTKLGPFLNKLKCCRLAKNEWIVLIDSDNFADYDYFLLGNNYIHNNNIKKESIISPTFAKPYFDYTWSNNKILNKNNLYRHHLTNKNLIVLMNTGNYIINKYLIDNIYIDRDIDTIEKSSAFDVILFNTILLEQFNIDIHCIENMHYSHIVHNNSIYETTKHEYTNINKYVHDRFIDFIKNQYKN